VSSEKSGFWSVFGERQILECSWRKADSGVFSEQRQKKLGVSSEVAGGTDVSKSQRLVEI
jgi:hypothetical protein